MQNSVGNGWASWRSSLAAGVGILCFGALTACSGDDHPPVIDDGSAGRSTSSGIRGGGTGLDTGGPSDDEPSGDCSTEVELKGTYLGTTTDSSGASRMKWVLSQSGTAVRGTVYGLTQSDMVVFTGSLTGKLCDSRLTFTARVPAGSISGAPTCSIDFSGTATATNTRIRGTYSGKNSCAGAFVGGNLDLVKQ